MLQQLTIQNTLFCIKISKLKLHGDENIRADYLFIVFSLIRLTSKMKHDYFKTTRVIEFRLKAAPKCPSETINFHAEEPEKEETVR